MCCAVFFPLYITWSVPHVLVQLVVQLAFCILMHYFTSPTTNQLYLCPAELTGMLLVLTSHHVY